MYKLLILISFLSACVDKPSRDCRQIKIEVNKTSPHKNFDRSRVLIFSFGNSNLLDEIHVESNGLRLKDTIDTFESLDYRYKYLEIMKNEMLVNEATIRLNNNCFRLKLDTTIRNYIIHMESKDSLRCFANNKEFIEIDG